MKPLSASMRFPWGIEVGWLEQGEVCMLKYCHPSMTCLVAGIKKGAISNRKSGEMWKMSVLGFEGSGGHFYCKFYSKISPKAP